MNDIRKILERLKTGEISIDEALVDLKTEPFDDIGFAKVDLHRKVRQGSSEVIYGEGKTADQIIGILTSMKEHGQGRVRITRLSKEKACRLSPLTALTATQDFA